MLIFTVMHYEFAFLAPYLLSSHDCAAKICSNSIHRFVFDTTTVSHISNKDDVEYRKVIESLDILYQANNLALMSAKVWE